MQENKKSKYFLWGLAGVLSLIGGFKLFEFELIKIVGVEVQLFFGSTQTPPEPTPSITKKLNCKNYKVTMPISVVSDPLRKKDVVIGEARNNCDNQPSCYSCERVAFELAKRDLAEQASLKLDARTTTENGRLTEDIIHSRTQAIIAHRKIIYKGYDADNNSYVYRLAAEVSSY
jgi:hypothetical protein